MLTSSLLILIHSSVLILVNNSHFNYYYTFTDSAPVVGLEGTTRDSTSIVLSWDAPLCPNGVITGYYIYYRISNTLVVNRNVEERFIDDLHPGVTYDFTVLAFNEEGESNRSDPFTIRTLEEGIHF